MDSKESRFTLIYDEYADPIFRHIYFRLGDRERALEILQEVFTGLWKQVREGKQIDNPKAFLYQSARNASINEWRDRKPLSSLETLSEKGFDVAYDTADAQELFEQKEVVMKLKQLNEPYRETLILRFIDGFQVKEIAEMLGENENTISVRIKRGIEKLKTYYA